MNDPVFLDAFYWLFMNTDFISLSSAVLTFFTVIISLILILKKWGGDY